MNRLLLAALVSLLPITALAQSDEEAGDVSEVDKDRVGPLRERVPPVSGNLFLKKGRFELSPSATVSLNDAFFTKYVLGATLGFFPTEYLGIRGRFGYAIPVVAGTAQICTTGEGGTQRGCRPPQFSQLDGRAPGQLSLIAGLDVEYSPIYGKVGLLAERFLHFDLFAVGGASMVNYKGPALTAAAASQPYTTFGGNVGVGSRIVINRFLTLRAELRDLIYVENVAGTPSTSLRNQLLFEVGLSIFLPTNFIAE